MNGSNNADGAYSSGEDFLATFTCENFPRDDKHWEAALPTLVGPVPGGVEFRVSLTNAQVKKADDSLSANSCPRQGTDWIKSDYVNNATGPEIAGSLAAAVKEQEGAGTSGNTGNTGNTGGGATSVSSWYQSIQSDYQQVTNDLSAIGTDGGDENLTALGSDCSQLTTDVDTLQADPPVPNATLNGLYQAGLSDYAKAGAECSSGVDQNDASLLDQALADITSGNSQFAQLTGQLKAMTGQ